VKRRESKPSFWWIKFRDPEGKIYRKNWKITEWWMKNVECGDPTPKQSPASAELQKDLKFK